MPRIVSYNVEIKGHQEEGVFVLTAEQIRTLAYAKKVDVELPGKYILTHGKFNILSTFKAFKNFVEEG